MGTVGPDHEKKRMAKKLLADLSLPQPRFEVLKHVFHSHIHKIKVLLS